MKTALLIVLLIGIAIFSASQVINAHVERDVLLQELLK